MKITLVTVGKIKERWWNDAIAEYGRRLGRYCTLQILEAPDEATPDSASRAEEAQILRREGERVLKLIERCSAAGSTRIIALAIEGKMYDSVSFADHLDSLQVSGSSHLVFVIGGSLGLSEQVLRSAHEKISFSKMTFPHQMMRVIALEQIYRAFRITRNEPYHK